MAVPYAFVTLVSSDAYLPGALALAASLKDIHPSPPVPPEVYFQTVCLVTPEIVDVSTIKHLRRAFDLVIGVEVIDQDDEKGLKLLGRPDLNTVLTKLHIFRLTQFSKIIFLDADVLPIRPLSHLFTLPHEFSAVPDVGWPDIFNSGVMVLSPGEDKFTQLTQLFKSKGSWDGGDQGILNEWRGNNWNRLSFTYNTTPTAAYTYAPAYERFGSQISAIHFIGPDKPWNSLAYRVPFINQSSSDSSQQAYDYGSLLDRWYSVYDKHYRSESTIPQPAPEVKRYESAWNETMGRGKQAALPAGSTLNLEELRKLAIEGMKAVSPTFHDKSGEGEYRSMPLGGRVDLMRPTKAEEAAEPARVDAVPEQKTRPPMLQIMPASEELPRTPVPLEIQLQPASPPLWRSQATPGPDEVPPSPQLRNISLPPTPLTSRHHYLHPIAEHQALPRLDESQEQREQPPGQQEQREQLPSQQERLQFGHQQQQRDSEPPPRPRSPPLLVWNPAVEPPPTATPTPSAFPSDTYFPNVWDQTPSKQHDQPRQSNSTTPNSGAFFQSPPPTEIPEMLLRQGHYRNVTGESNMSSPSPDRAKVKSVFPWEEKPRHLPGRVFPVTDSPSPSLFLSPESQPSSSEVPVTPERKTIAPVLSPLSGLPFALTYANAWDHVPSIQKYASRLVRPPAPRPLAPAFDENDWKKKKTREDKAEVSSRDGDVEDEGEESVGDDSEEEADMALPRRPRRGSSISLTDTVSERKKYRAFGVQTTSCDTRSIGVQVETIHSKNDRSWDRDRRPSMSSNRHWAPSGRSNVPPSVTMHAVSTRSEPTSALKFGSLSTASQLLPSATSGRSNDPPSLTTHAASIRSEPSPVPQSGSLSTTSPAMSPASAHTFPPSPIIARSSTKTVTPHLRTISGSPHSPSVIARQPSNDSSLGSPASSLGPLSPADGQPISTPVRKAGRVWDPARGVDLVKRGSEEVLARFLRMGPWDHDNR